MLFLMMMTGMVSAQQMPKLPSDPSVRTGKLDNGLTYYIRYNNYPEHVANFYIAQRVGSIQEEDHQRGLAHFLEHMAFNGSKHFKDNGIIEFCRAHGVAFGKDLNAYTSIERTVYNIDNVPTANQEVLDSCLLILQDWSNGLLLLTEEIDKERGVIHGEWAMRNSASQRLFERNLPLMYPDCRYGYRMPIGTMEIVDNFSPEALRQYYAKWYHPENQAIIVVGDVDVDHTEAKIKELFAGIKAGPDAAHVEPILVPDNKEAIYIFDKDKEMQNTSIALMMKHNPFPKELQNTMADAVKSYVSSMISGMFNSRMGEISQQSDCPFTGLGMSQGDYMVSSTKECVEFSASAKEGKDLEALKALVREAVRAKKYGFTSSEYARVKESFLSNVERTYSNRNKRTHTSLYDECLANYIDGDVITTPETDYEVCKQIAEMVTLDMINQTVQQMITIDNDSNLVCYMFAQDKEGVVSPTTDDLRKVVNETRVEPVTAWVDNAKDEPLIAKLPKAGKIKKEKKNDKFGYTELYLSNGAKVIMKKTDYRETEVSLAGFAPGGAAQYGEADYTNLKVFNSIIVGCGLGNFSTTELRKALAGKQARAGIGLGNRYNNVSGSSTPKDMETMMQLLYLYFTDIRKDEQPIQRFLEQLPTNLKNRNLKPESQLSDSLTINMNCGNARFTSMTLEDIDKIDVDRIVSMAKENFKDVNNFTFFIIGNIDEQKTRELVCQYIASLPGKGKEIKTQDVRTYFTSSKTCDFKRQMETPKPYIAQIYKSETEDNLKNSILSHITGEVLSMMLLKSVREDAGASYSISASCNISATRDKKEKVYSIMQIQTPISAPEKQDLALELIQKDIKTLCESADADMVAKVKENMLKNIDISVKQNSYWMNIIQDYVMEGVDNHTDYKKTVESITPDMVSAYLKSIIDGNCMLNVVMRPE